MGARLSELHSNLLSCCSHFSPRVSLEVDKTDIMGRRGSYKGLWKGKIKNTQLLYDIRESCWRVGHTVWLSQNCTELVKLKCTMPCSSLFGYSEQRNTYRTLSHIHTHIMRHMMSVSSLLDDWFASSLRCKTFSSVPHNRITGASSRWKQDWWVDGKPA